MSKHLLSWAVDECERREVPMAARMLLVVLVRMANNETGCSHPGKACLARKTGMPLRSLFNAMETLVAEGLVGREKRGKSWLYKVAVTAHAGNGSAQTSAPRADVTSAPVADNEVSSATLADLTALSSAVDADKMSAPVADEAKTSAKSASDIGKNRHEISAPVADRTYKVTYERELSACAPRDAGRRSPDGAAGSALPAKDEAAPPEPPPKAPVLGATDGSVPPGNALRPPGQSDPFDDAGEDNAGWIARHLSKRAAALAVERPKAIYAPSNVIQLARQQLAQRAAARAP